MLRALVAVAVILVVAAAVVAVQEGKLSNLLIGAAMVASNAAIFAAMMEWKLGDAYDTGGQARERSLLRELTGLTHPAKD